MDAMVPPNGTNPGFVVNDETHGWHGGHRSDHDVVLHEIADGTRAILNDVGNNSRAVLNEVANSSRFGIKETADASRLLMKEVCDTSHDGIEATAEQGAETRAQGEAHRASDERLHLATREAAERSFIQSFANQAEIRRDVLGEAQNIKLLTADRFTALDKWLCDKFGENTRDVLKGFADTQLDAARNTAGLQLTAAQNAAKLSAELAECCCEVKELVRTEATSTRELIQSTETQRLRDALASANQELLTIKIGGLRAAA